MGIGLIGKKCGMSRIFNEDGSAVAVTVIKIEPNTVVQVKTEQTDGYDAIQVTTGSLKRSRLTKPMTGHYAKAGVEAGRLLKEFRTEATEAEYSIGNVIPLDILKEGEYVDVQAKSIGKGFQGVVKKYNFRTQDATHGNSLSHRAPGSIGQNQTPGRVFKGKKMAGHMGDKNVTVQNLEICKIDTEKSLILVKGAIPGSVGGNVILKKSIKK